MADLTGRLTPQDMEKAKVWWTNHWKGDVLCPVCKSNRWVTGEFLVNLPRFTTTGPLDGPTHPKVQVMSVPCGYTMLFNAVEMGIVTPYSGAG